MNTKSKIFTSKSLFINQNKKEMNILFLALNLFAIFDYSTQHKFEFINNSPFQNLKIREYKLFTNWLDCNERGAVLFYYLTVPDTGNLPRPTSFRFDPDFPRDCQQTSSSSYGSIYDRGHLVPANHLDHDDVAIKESNYITNILPQHNKLNRMAWLVTEEITECLRDDFDLEVIGGIIMGDNVENDIFVKSHGVRTPDFFWKILINLNNGDVNAWIMPNDETTAVRKIDPYLVTISEIEQKSGFYFIGITDEQRYKKQTVSWAIPKGCDKSK